MEAQKTCGCMSVEVRILTGALDFDCGPKAFSIFQYSTFLTLTQTLQTHVDASGCNGMHYHLCVCFKW